MTEKIYGPIKQNKDDLGNFETYKKLTRHPNNLNFSLDA